MVAIVLTNSNWSLWSGHDLLLQYTSDRDGSHSYSLSLIALFIHPTIHIKIICHCPSDRLVAAGRHDISSYSWWRHQMEAFSALLANCAGNSPVTGEFPAQRPVTRSFDVFFDLRLNKRLSKQSWGEWFETSSRSLCRHYNVSHDRSSISPWIKSISNELDVTFHVPASQLSGHCDLISNRSWRHQLNEKRASEPRGRCVKFVRRLYCRLWIHYVVSEMK